MVTRADIAVRAADAAALDRVMAVMAASFDPEFGEAWTQLQCGGMLADAKAWLLLGDWRGAVAGFALARQVVDEAELLLIAVTPAARGQGLGAALLETVTRDARRRGADRLFLEVRADNPAIALYRGAGFDKVGERRGYYRGVGGKSFDAHSYARALRG